MMLWVCPNKWAKRKKRLSEGIKCVVPKRRFFKAQIIDNKGLFLKHHEFRPTVFLGRQMGTLDNRQFSVRQCSLCHFSYVENYRTDFQNIYDENYYRGFGADRMVDYVYELENASKTIRNYEWKGVCSIYHELCPNGGYWLDYGCGMGGLVNFAIESGIEIIGFEEGWAADAGKFWGTPIIGSSEIEKYTRHFSFISAIEVIEHIPNPLDALLKIRSLLKPGGILFITTGNAEPWRNNLLAWDYTKCPEVHVSFYEPETLSKCMRMTGFQPRKFKFFSGFSDIIKFKCLKAFRVKKMSKLIDILPWSIISKLVDARYKVSSQPYGVAIDGR